MLDYVVSFGLVLPALGVVFLVEGDGGGKLAGAVVIAMSLAALMLLLRRRK
jgi:multisubunit Na+/H+ antiporter MnhB subunit